MLRVQVPDRACTISTMTTVIHCKREKHGPNYVYIGRPSKWGNPLFYFCSSKLVRRARVAQPVAKAEMNWFVPCGKPLSKYS